MAAETGFIIDGDRYEVPTLDTFTMDEAQVLYDYSGLTIEDFVPMAEPPPLADDADVDAKARHEELIVGRDDELAALAEKLRNPGFLRALTHVAYQRKNPHLKTDRVKAMIGTTDHAENLVAFIEAGSEAGDVVPPALTTEPGQSSPKSSVSSNEDSGANSTTLSVVPEDQPEPTTTGGSDTSSEPALTTSAG